MHYAIIKIVLEIHMAHSLKDRRQGLEPIKSRIARLANFAVIESEQELLWNRAQIWVVVMAQNLSLLDKRIDELLGIIDNNATTELLEYEIEKNAIPDQ